MLKRLSLFSQLILVVSCLCLSLTKASASFEKTRPEITPKPEAVPARAPSPALVLTPAPLPLGNAFVSMKQDPPAPLYRPSAAANATILSSVMIGLVLVPFGASTMTSSYVDTTAHQVGTGTLIAGGTLWLTASLTAIIDRALERKNFNRCVAQHRFVEDCTRY